MSSSTTTYNKGIWQRVAIPCEKFSQGKTRETLLTLSVNYRK
jgi:hypothetical protein